MCHKTTAVMEQQLWGFSSFWLSASFFAVMTDIHAAVKIQSPWGIATFFCKGRRKSLPLAVLIAVCKPSLFPNFTISFFSFSFLRCTSIKAKANSDVFSFRFFALCTRGRNKIGWYAADNAHVRLTEAIDNKHRINFDKTGLVFGHYSCMVS